MKLTRRTAWGATALAVGALALASCSQAPDGGGDGEGSGENEAIEASANDINEMDVSELGQGGTLRLANNAYPANWNGLHSDGNEVNTTQILNAIYPTLYLYTAEGEVVPNPQYTKRLELISEDPQVIEIELNEGMTWSDGTPIDYTSIENVFKVMDGSQEGYGIASSGGYDQVEKIEQGDNELTARVTFSEPYADWRGLAAVAPDSLVESADAFNTSFLDEPAVTAGPYKVKELDAKNKTVLLEPDENWWGDPALLDQVLFTTIEDPAASAASFQNGQLDVLDASVPAQYSVVEPMIGDGVVLRKAAGPNWSHITLNGSEGNQLEDVAIRQAIQKAFDREEMFLAVNGTMPYPDDVVQQNNHLLMTNQDGYIDNAGDTADGDIEGARAILEEAGYEWDGDGNLLLEGEPLEIDYTYNDGSKTNEAVLPIVQENLAEIGITVTERKVPPTDLFAKYVIPGDFDMTLFGWAGNPFLASGDTIWRTDGEQNFGKVGDETVDDLLAQAAVEADMDTRLDLMNQADAEMWNLAGTVPLWQSYDFFVQDEDLANYGAWGFQMPDWTKIGYVAGSDNLEG
ncbi:ABC transporter family substrate-binding protein [Microbacterium halophytorum]|uniref:ABC transporter family substrate-binding protein n=1 Tax=Microbacterium halophytorum TaxID=2067568 RepID=UPI000CFB165F|nr:ABC transporter family substrate-binding protein [Microbacterium halophytorum]